jgi:hypothetical protein
MRLLGEQVACVWVGYLRFIQGMEEHVAGDEVDEIVGLASGMDVGRIVEYDSKARRAGCR